MGQKHNVKINIQTTNSDNGMIAKVRNTLVLLILMCGISNAAWGESISKWNGTLENNATNKLAEHNIALQTPGEANSATNPYLISDADGFAYFMRVVQMSWTGRASTFYWKLTKDIDLDNQPWTFGTNNGGSFQGHFDGDGHTVKNISIAVSGNNSHGLFPTIQGASATNLAEVKNLKIDGVKFVSDDPRAGTTRVGALAGYVRQANISDVQVKNVIVCYNSTITDNNQIGAVIGGMDNNTTLNNVDATSLTVTFFNTTYKAYVGGIVGNAGGTANTSDMTKCDAKKITVIHKSYCKEQTYIGGLVGNSGSGLKTINNNTVDSLTVTVSDADVQKNLYAGGLLGNTAGNVHEVKGNTVSKVQITVDGIMNNNRLGGMIGHLETSGTGSVIVKRNSATDIKITSNGTTAGNNYLGGFIAYAKGKASPNDRSVVQADTVTNATLKMNGVIANTLYMGGLVGYADAHTNLLNNKVVNPQLSITENINNATYVGGAVGAQANYTYIDGMTVSGGSIYGNETTDKILKYNINFYVGGFIGMQGSSSTANYQPTKFKNIAVTDIDINFKHIIPETTITNHKFSIGGIAGTVNAPNQDALGNRGMAENIIFKGGKIFAPYATTSPTVSNFNTSNTSQNTMTPDVVTTIDALEKSKTKSWYYSDYKLGLTDEVINNTSAWGTAPEKDHYRNNYQTTPVLDDVTGIKYITVNGETFKRSNRYLDGERDSKTVLCWTATASYAAAGASAVLFTDNDQPIYPHQANSTAGNATLYPLYWYFFQGVSNANYVAPTDAQKIIEGIAGNMEQATEDAPVTLTITNDKENERGFAQRNITVSATTVDNEGNETPATSITSYQWYLNGAPYSTETSVTLTPHWKDGQALTVVAYNGSKIVATASYTLIPGVMKTQNDAEVRADLNTLGTVTNPYIIDCENALRQLSYLSTYSKSLYFEGLSKLSTDGKNPHHSMMHYNRAYYILTADIDMGGREFTPISHAGYSSDGTWGTNHQDYVFQGYFNGNGHKISNFNVKWSAGYVNSGNISSYHGLFGALGNITATAKWGDGAPTNTVVKNLVIANATFTHDTNNKSFFVPNTTTGNYCMVGVLAGIVSSNTTVQNIEIRNSSITDAGSDVEGYSLAKKGLYVGGAIGSLQYGIGNSSKSQTDLIPSSTKIEHIAAQVDITLTHPKFETQVQAELSQLNVGGIIGRFIATSATQQEVQEVMPKYTFYSGRIYSPKAWISPVLASLRYSAKNEFAYYSRLWEGNNNAEGTQINIEGAQYYKYYIGDTSSDANLITNLYPSNTCTMEARSIMFHQDAMESLNIYDARKYQGVNYNATFIDSNQQSLQALNLNPTDEYNWKWSAGDNSFPELTKEPYVGAFLTRNDNTFTANITGAAPTSYTWKASFDGITWHDITGEKGKTYTAPASLKPKYIVAFVNTDYRTLPEVVEKADEATISPKITAQAAPTDGQIFTVNLNNTTPINHLTPTYQWYKSDNKTEWSGERTSALQLTTTQFNDSKNMVWCTVTMTELGEVVGTYNVSYGATVVYVDKENGLDTNNGRTPETAVKTIDHANSLLKPTNEGGTMDNNVIVIMGALNGNDNKAASIFRSKGTNPATLTGKWNDVDYNGTIYIIQYKTGTGTTDEETANDVPGDMTKNGYHCYVMADTKFEYLTFKAASENEENNFIECHGHDVWFGKGIKMTNFCNLSEGHGNLDKAQNIPELTIVLTATNPSPNDIEKYYQGRTKPQTLTIESGRYGRIMGGRFTNKFFNNGTNLAHTILGTADHPIWAVINVDIDKNNPTEGTINRKQAPNTGWVVDNYTCDINCIIAGLTDGTMYGDYEINLHGGKVNYIVGGNQGNAVRNGTKTYRVSGGNEDAWGQWPNASYFGRSVINIEQNNDLKPIEVANLYAGGLGRNVQSSSSALSSIDMFVYGHTEVNVKSGEITGNVFGGGAGGVIGTNPWDAHAPYKAADAADNADNAIYKGVQYGDTRYGSWSGKTTTDSLANVTLHNPDGKGGYTTELLNLGNSSTTVNITGGSILGNVYGGGAGYVSNMPKESTMDGVGSVFGITNVNISGNPVISGNVYGGSMGHDKYFNQVNNYGQTITHIAETNGIVNIYINGTEDKCPDIKGNIYGAGQGIASTLTENYPRVATTGNTDLGENYKSEINLTIDLPETEAHKFAGKIYGGGELGMVDGTVNVNIKHGIYNGTVFGGGYGEEGHADKAKVTGETFVNISNGNLTDNVFGGGEKAKVIGSTNVTIDDGVIEGSVYGGGDKGSVSDMTRVLMSGGYIRGDLFGGGNMATVGTDYTTGDRNEWANANGTSVELNGPFATVYGNIFGGGNQANINGNTSVRLVSGHFGSNIFGGGNGILYTLADQEKNYEHKAFTPKAYADVTNNSSVYLEGSNVLWDELWDKDNKEVVVWNGKWDGDNREKFIKGTEKEPEFIMPHNVYGGGNQACRVAGNDSVFVAKGFANAALLQTDIWKNSFYDDTHPHFYVFGGGYGPFTTATNTFVGAGVEGVYEDATTKEQLAKRFLANFIQDGGNDKLNNSTANGRRTEANAKSASTILNKQSSAGGPGSDETELGVYDNSFGIPLYTVLGVLGGGYSGLISGNTSVTVGGETFIHRVYGGGYGSLQNYKELDSNPTVSAVANGLAAGNSTFDAYNADSRNLRDILGEVRGKTDVTVNGAFVYGDVFGGGAGVESASLESVLTDFPNMARVIGNGVDASNAVTKVTISEKAQIYGSVYGGADVANVGTPTSCDGDSKPSYNPETDALTNVKSFVKVIGGNIYGEVFGGGGGRQHYTLENGDFTQTTADVDVLGRIEGNTLVYIANTPGETPEDEENIPNVWQRIYGGGNMGSVNGNTKVWLEGGNIGLNIIGGGNGYAADDNPDSQTHGTYANVYGNTNITIDGGSIIWDKLADAQGNVTEWTNATMQLIKTEKEMRQLYVSRPDSIKEILVPHLDKRFFDYAEGEHSKMKFPINHNIYGGGRYACHVGSYAGEINKNNLSANTGSSTVTLNHGMVQDENLLDIRTVAGLCWYSIINNSSEPQFSVFGGGFGANTTVANTEVNMQIGKPANYKAKEEDDAAWLAYETKLQEDWENVTNEEKINLYGGTNENAYRRYRTSRYALSLGVPNHTFMNVYGGGYSGYVVDNTIVNVSGKSGMRNVYGGGLGAVKDRSVPMTKVEGKLVEATLLKAGDTTSSSLTYGKVGGNTNVNIEGGIISLNVYGGGAGVESKYLNEGKLVTNSSDPDDMLRAATEGTLTDFPYMANVVGKTNVNITGSIEDDAMMHKIDGTIIYGKVFGGGDVANVGNIGTTADAIVWVNNEGNKATEAGDDYAGDAFTSTVKIDGGLIFSEVLAGGSGRDTLDCHDYRTLGGIYGNSRVIIKNNNSNSTFSPWLWNNIYGGGESGTVYGNSLVQIRGGHLGYNIFGGGWGVVKDGSVSSANIKRNTLVDISDGEYVLTQMWNEQTRSWYPNNQHNSPQYDYDTKKFFINHNIYGGGNNACTIGGSTWVKMTKGLLKETTQVTYEGNSNLFETDEWYNVFNKTGSPHFSVYGGGYGSSTCIEGNTNLDINLPAVNGHTIANAPTITDNNMLYQHFFSEQAVMDITGGGYSGTVKGIANVNIGGDTFARRILGGGFYGSVGETKINIKSVDCSDIFGGGLMGNVGTARQSDPTNGELISGNGVATITIGDPDATSEFNENNIWIHKNVYGANDVSGSIFSCANINIYGGNILGNVYGAGNGNYLYAQGDKNTKQVTVNEYYKTAETTYDLVYTVPTRSFMPSVANASEAQKMVNVNSFRPTTQNVSIKLLGKEGSKVRIDGNVFGGGNSASVNEVLENCKPSVNITLGSYLSIGGVYLGCDGDAMFNDETDFMNAYQDVNKIDLTHSIDWVHDPGNKAVTHQYLPFNDSEREKIYKSNLDLYFQPVEMSIQPTVIWGADGSGSITNTTIGTFVCGGNRGNMNVAPNEETGKIVDITFPAGLTIKDKIVGGCNNANITYKNTYHEGGYLLGKRNPTAADNSGNNDISLTVKCQFLPQIGESGTLEGGNVYGGCYKSGTINGDIFLDIQTNMLTNITKEELSANKKMDGVPLGNVYGAGYGNDSYVYGNTTVLFGKGVSKNQSFTTSRDVAASAKARALVSPAEAKGAAANYVYGGGQQGNLIGNSLVRIYNGHIAASVCGGSYAGYMWGSTQVLVGYPKYYTCQKSGIYNVKRADKWNSTQPSATHGGMNGYHNYDKTEVIKQQIFLLKGDVVSEDVFDAINDYDNEAFAKDGSYVRKATTGVDDGSHNFSLAKQTTPGIEGSINGQTALTWNDIDINIADAVYGGGYSLASGSSVAAGTYTVKKYDATKNIDGELTTAQLEELNDINGGKGSKGFGGNTTVLVWDRATAPTDGTTDMDHISISSQSMREVKLEQGTDLFGYYYKNNGDYTYIYQEDTYFYGNDAHDGKTYYENVWESDSEGGMYGDGHLSFAEGFRVGEINGYGFAGANPNGAKLINTFQRMDILRVQDCSLVLLGARDYTVTELSTTPYSIARVGELQMRSPGVQLSDGKIQTTDKRRSRNYVGFSNNIHYIGAVDSDVAFDTDDYHYGNKQISTNAYGSTKSSTSYRAEKQAYVDNYKSSKIESEFQKRNDGTAKNMIGIASGYAMKLQNVYTTDDKNAEDIFYGPIVGVVEMNLINVREDEGGGYVYADNIHHRASDGSVPEHAEQTEDFLETSGNFVFPYDQARNRYIVDDCFPTDYYTRNSTGEGLADSTRVNGIHYWYVTGYNYYYNAHITGYTYDSSTNPLYFNNDNQDGLLVLSGVKAGQTVTLKSIKWRSNHITAPVLYSAEEIVNIDGKNYVKSTCNDDGHGNYTVKGDGTSVEANVGDIKINNNGFIKCDLETNATDMATACADETVKGKGNTKTDGVYDHYNLSLSVPGAKTAEDPGIQQDVKVAGVYTTTEAHIANLPMNSTDATGYTADLTPNVSAGSNDPAITFQLKDKVDNSGNDYYQKYMAQPCEATLTLTAPALDGEGNQISSFVPIQYFFTRSGDSPSNFAYTKVSGKLDLTGDTKYYYFGNGNEYHEITDVNNITFYDQIRQDYISVLTGADAVPYQNVDEYNEGKYTPISETQYNALSDKEKIKYPAISAGDVTSGGAMTYYYDDQRSFTYTIYLTIDYVPGPSYTGNLKIHNCALPGEMIKIDKGNIKLTGDQTFSQSGTTYRFGKRVKEDGNWTFINNSDYPVYDYNIEAEGSSEMLADVHYDKDGDFILVPAYYFMNGYGVQYIFKVNNIPNDFSVDMADENTLLIHNYHRMLPRSSSGGKQEIDQHLDLATKRHRLETASAEAMPESSVAEREAKEAAIKAILPEPRIYLVDNRDLNEFGRFLNEKENESAAVGSKYDFGRNMQFFLQRDITAVSETKIEDGIELRPYVAPSGFKGILHGDGHIINGINNLANRYLIGGSAENNTGNIYNLGLTSGVITEGDEGNDNPRYHCCFTYTPDPEASASGQHVVYRMNGKAFTGYTENDWRYGKVAYDLNQYYLDSRFARNSDQSGTSTDNAHSYIENYYANGDFLYADYSGDNHYKGSEFLRTAARPNYGQSSSLHDSKHTIDASRAVGYVPATAESGTPGEPGYTEAVPASFDGTYLPLFDAKCITDNAVTVTDREKNDYIFWGQRQNSATKNADPAIVNITTPANISADLDITFAKGVHLISDMSTRVYRAGGYYGSTINNGYYYNHDGYAHSNNVTAIDFYGYKDRTAGEPLAKTYTDYSESASIGGSVGSNEGTDITFYQPVADYGLKSFAINKNTTRNLLLYANSNDDLTPTGSLNSQIYTENSYEDEITAHVIGQTGTGASVSPQTTYLHLVERTADNLDASADKQYLNDFCVPIAFNVTKRAWYERKPVRYAETSNDAWEGICLPFNANKVVASLNGEITHFYGVPSSDEINDPATNYHNLHHEYWLRGLRSVGDGTGIMACKKIGDFQRPGVSDDLFCPKDAETPLQETMSYVFSNEFFTSTYGTHNYNSAPTQNDWYTKQQTYPDYIQLTNSIPYIVSFPGYRYYEFDLSSKFYDKVINDGVSMTEAQTVTFNAYGPESSVTNRAAIVTIPVTEVMSTTTESNFVHVGTFMTLDNAQYGMAEAGTSFTTEMNNVLPFRTYMKSVAPAPAKSIAIGSFSKEQEGIESEFGGDPDNGIVENGLHIFPQGQKVIVESNYSTTLSIYTPTGGIYRIIDVRPGRNTYSGFHSGIYIVGTKKLFLQ